MTDAPTPIDPAAVHDFVEARTGELRDLLADLVAAVSVNPPGDEHRPAEVVKRFFDALDIPYETYEAEPGRTNVVARVGTGRPRLLVGLHLDVVPAGDGWESAPFELTETEPGVLAARGVMDDKGPLASAMIAAAYLKERETDLGGEFILVAAADEEAGSELGMKYLLEEVGLEADMAIVPDAGHGMKLIDVGEKGVLFLRVQADGVQAHGSEPQRGASALWPMIDFLNRIRNWRPPGEKSDLFSPPTLNVGAIHAGSVPNMVPGRCEARLDLRYLPGADGHAILDYLRSVLRDVEVTAPGVKMTLEVTSHQLPSLVSGDHPLVERLTERTEQVTGIRPELFGMSGATVAKFMVLAGIPAVGFLPGPEGVAHMAGEWVKLDDLARFAEVLILTSWDLLSGGTPDDRT